MRLIISQFCMETRSDNNKAVSTTTRLPRSFPFFRYQYDEGTWNSALKMWPYHGKLNRILYRHGCYTDDEGSLTRQEFLDDI